LPFGEALADHEVDRGLDEGRRDALAVAPALGVVRDRTGVVGEVGAKLGRGAREALQARVVAGQAVEVIGQPLGPEQSLADVAVPKMPLDFGPCARAERCTDLSENAFLFSSLLPSPGKPEFRASFSRNSSQKSLTSARMFCEAVMP
jgi:hypothetical protein